MARFNNKGIQIKIASAAALSVVLCATLAIAPMAMASNSEAIAEQAGITPAVVNYVSEGNATAAATASDTTYRVQETTMEVAPTEDKSVVETSANDPVKTATVENNEKSSTDAVLSDTADGKDTKAEEKVLAPRTLDIGGVHIPYIDYFEQASAPEHGAGLWLGSESTTDNDWGYFIGHNPGDFAPVMDLVEGDVVSACDSDAATRDYVVVDVFNVDEGTYWHEIEERVSGYGESIILQACCGDNAHYRVVVAVAA